MKKIVYVDMDNVLVDFQSGIDAMQDVITAEYDGRIDEVPGIFAQMKPLPGAIEAYHALCEKFDCYILSTSPWSNPTAASDKFAWVKKYLGDVAHKRLILSHHKNLNRGDYLIDDRPNKCGADKFEGEVIAFGSEQFPDWESVTSYLLGGTYSRKKSGEEYARQAKEYIENIDSRGIDWDAEIKRHQEMHKRLEEQEYAGEESSTYYSTEQPHVLTITTHPGKLGISDVVSNIMRMMMMDRIKDICTVPDAQTAEEYIEHLSREEFISLKGTAISYFWDWEWQKYFERKHIYEGLDLVPIEEETAREMMDEFSLESFELQELPETEWD